MRVMVIVKATKESEAESHPLEMEGAEEMFEQMGRFNEELIKAGIMLVKITSAKACNTARIGVIGAFEPPVTG